MLTVVQVLPAMEGGGVEKGTLEIAAGLVRDGHRSIVISQGGRLIEQLLEQGSEHIDWPIGKKSLLTLRYLTKLRSLLIKESVDILHARSRLPAWIAYLAWRKMDANNRPAFITTVHGNYSVNSYSKIMMRGEKVIAVSNHIRRYITDNYTDINENKLNVIHRGVEEAEFPRGYTPSEAWLECWRRAQPNLENKFIIALPARITRRKGQVDFIKIIHALKNLNLPVVGLIVGKPDPKHIQFLSELKEEVVATGLTDQVKFIGHRDDLKEIMAISTIVLSLSNKPEAFGRIALEALSIGVPVVAYNHGGASEILAELFPEGLVEPNNIIAATEKIRSLYCKKTTIKENCCFELKSMVNKTIELYEQTAADKLK